jgi:ethanolaminephosphotransferase
VILSLSVFIWVGSPYSAILSDNHLVLFALSLSFTFGRTTTAIILAHLTRQEFPYLSLPMIPLLIGTLLFGILPASGFPSPGSEFEVAYLWLFFVFNVVYFARYAQLVIDAICGFLGISAFSVRRADVKLS